MRDISRKFQWVDGCDAEFIGTSHGTNKREKDKECALHYELYYFGKHHFQWKRVFLLFPSEIYPI